MKIEKALAIATTKQGALELAAGAASLAEYTVVVYLGAELPQIQADRCFHVDTSKQSALLCLESLVALVKEIEPQLVLAECSRDGRLCAAYVAAKLGTCVMADAGSVKLDENGVTTTRMVYGGKGIKTENRKGQAVVCVSAGVFTTENGKAVCQSAEQLAASAQGVEQISVEAKEVQSTQLATAKKVVGVGRGLKEEENLQYINELMQLIGADVACTRPVADEMKWYGRERYLGVSGLVIKPELYIAVGISGQIQHTIGVNEAGTILAINRDKDAPIFSQCDIGIVGDAKDTLIALNQAIKDMNA